MYTIDENWRRATPLITKLVLECLEEHATSWSPTAVIYAVMRDQIVKAVEAAGKTCRLVPGARLRLDVPEVREYCELWPSYFLRDPGPQLYIIHSPWRPPVGEFLQLLEGSCKSGQGPTADPEDR